MKRPLLCCIIAFIAGIFFSSNIWGIAFFAILFVLCEMFCYLSKRVEKYNALMLIFVNTKALVWFCVVAGMVYFLSFNFFRVKEVDIFNNKEKEIIGVISNEGIKKDSYFQYVLKNNFINGKKIKSNILINSKKSLNYGDKIKVTALLEVPKGERNKNTFDYAKYLRTLNIYLIAEIQDVEIVSKDNLLFVEKFGYIVRKKVREFSKKTLNSINSGIFNALLVGDESELKYNVEEEYKKAGMLHLLVVSGGHTVFLILLLKFIFSYINLDLNISKILYVIIIFLYIFITGATASILRAGIGIIIVILAGLIGRENDRFTTLGLVAFILLINNPNTLYSLSFLLSFGGVLGIMICYSKVKKLLSFIPEIISEPLALTVAAQLFVTPITVYSFNVVYLGGIISNILTLNLSGIIMMAGIVLFILYLFFSSLVFFPMKVISFLISVMNKVAEFFSEIEIMMQYVTTPNILSVVLYYIIVIYVFGERKEQDEKSLTIIRFPRMPLFVRMNIKKIVACCGIMSILLLNIRIVDFDKSLKISIIDVGHGDSILITTPNDKYILIDTGDKYYNKEKEYDTGEQTIIPYLLKQGIKRIDLLILSHMDSDHIGGFESISNVIEIKTLGLSVNSGLKEEYSIIRDIAIENKIHIKELKRGVNFYIDGVTFKVLMPVKKDNILEENNDSVVLLMEYQSKKALFMGDLEKEGEYEILEFYKELDIDILKVGHHGSITSSTSEFIEKVKPEISLISVGNRFKSIPSKEVINRLSSVHSKVYRTDKMGEINVIIDKGKICVKTTY